MITACLILAFAYALLAQTPKFLPMSYSSLVPYQFEINRKTVSLQMTLCSTTQYTGCTANLFFNLPFTPWSVPDGTFLNFTAFTSSDSCGTQLCANKPDDAKSPNSCSFTISSSMGDRIFVVGRSGNSAGFQATFVMNITCPSNHLESLPKETVEPPRPKSGLSACPPADPTKRTIIATVPSSTPTSSRTTDARKFALSVCPDQKAYAKVSFRSQSVDEKSAMATYFCPASACNTNSSPPGWFDQSGTAINNVEINNLPAGVIFFTVYGWGEYNGMNSFVFNIEINDQ